MANGATDPIQGLVDYVLEVKPYHTKIIEVLIEYVHEDFINVDFVENLDMCVNMYVPDIDSQYSYPIVSVNTTNNSFFISGDKRLHLHVGQTMEVFNSTVNDNRYTITSLSYNGTNTEVQVQETIPSSIADGIIVYRVIEYCPDGNLYSTYLAPENIQEMCAGGFGDIYDSYPTTYDVVNVNVAQQEVVISGNVQTAFEIGNQFFLDYTTNVDDTTVVEQAYTISNVTVDTSDPVNITSTIVTEQPIIVAGSPAVSIDNAYVYPLNPKYSIIGINQNSTTNTFTVSGNVSNIIYPGAAITVQYSDGNDGTYYVVSSQLDGSNTLIHVSQHVPFPSASYLGSLSLNYLGFDDVIQCSTIPEARIDIRFDERLDFSTKTELRDTLFAYNLENNNEASFGGLPYTTVVSSTEPTITESATAPSPSGSPLSIPLHTIWYNTSQPNTAHLRMWNGLEWEKVDAVYWYNPDTEQLSQRIYRQVGGNTVDTGWVNVALLGFGSGDYIDHDTDLTNSTVLFSAYDSEPHIVYHGPEGRLQGSPQTDVDYVTPQKTSGTVDRYDIYGGNFVYHFLNGTVFEGFDDTQKLGEWTITQFSIVEVGTGGSPITNTITVSGNQLNYFTAGKHFYVDYSVNNKGWFTVSNQPAVYDAVNNVTKVYVTRDVTQTSITNVQQTYTKDLGIVQGALYDSSTQTTTVILNAAGDENVDRIQYRWLGPIQMDVDLLPGDLIGTDSSDSISMSGELISQANYLDIVDADTSLDSFTVLGDQTSHFPADATFNITGAYTDNGSPETTNNGAWSVSYSYYNGAGVENILEADTVNDRFRISGNHTSKFVSGFEFEVSQSGSPSNDGSYIVVSPGSTYVPGSDSTWIPVTTEVPSTDANGLLSFSGTDETLIFINGSVVTDQTPYGRIVDIQSSISDARLSSSIVDSINFGWTVEDWFQYQIMNVNLDNNTIVVAGDARNDLQIGQDFEIIGAFDSTGSPSGSPSGVTNNGIYKVRIDEDYRLGSPPRSEVDYDGANTTITIYPELSTDVSPYGFIEPNNDAQMKISLIDSIGISVGETADGAVTQTGGSLVDSWDYPYWDVGSLDETLGTVIHLYDNTFPAD